MKTKVCFTNLSLNCHQPQVTLFQQCCKGDSQLWLAWKVIKRCGYQWQHPFSIDWSYQYRFTDDCGNYSQIYELPESENTELSHHYIRVVMQAKTLSFAKLPHCKYTGVELLKSGTPIACLALIGEQVAQFQLSSLFFIGADLDAEPGEVIHPANINMSVSCLDIAAKKKMAIKMKGGQPGPYSEPLTFIVN